MTPIQVGIMCGLVSTVMMLHISMYRQIKITAELQCLTKLAVEDIERLRSRIEELEARCTDSAGGNDITTRPHTPEADQAEV